MAASKKKAQRRKEMEYEEEEVKAILKEAFGDTSSSEEDEEEISNDEEINNNNKCSTSIYGDDIWESIKEISGLWICRDFLSPHQHSSVLSSLHKEGFLSHTSQNQAMRFGNLPHWAVELSRLIRDNVLSSGYFSESMNTNTSDDEGKETCLFPPELLWREPLFNQLIVNSYQPGEGICAHVDLMRFEDGIAIISLESSCVMHFSPVETECSGVGTPVKIPVLLTPGSVILMWGEARYKWKHEINRKPGFQYWEGQEIEQKRRTSVTLRRLCQTE